MSDEQREHSNESNEQDLPRVRDLLRWSEETRRTINFMLQQQAQFEAKLEASRAEADARHARIEALVGQLAISSLRRFEKVEGEVSELDRKMDALVDSHIRLADTQKEGEARLNAFIATVERLINERRNGGRKETGGAADE